MKRLLIACLALLGTPAFAQQTAPEIAFTSVPDFPKLPDGFNFGEVPGVAVNAQGHVFVFPRSNSANGPAYAPTAAQLLEFDHDGNFLREIGKGLYAWSFAHSVRIDSQGNIWAIDKGSDMIVKFNPQGRVQWVFGRRKESADDETGPWEHVNPPLPPVDGLFRQPTDVAWDSQGNIYITDGYINSRVAKFDKDGDWVKSWGAKGTGPGQFNLPHAIAIDSRGRLFVADRDNNRIQIFDQDGKFLDQWKQFGRPSGLHIAADDTLYVSDNQSNNERHPGWTRGIRVGSALDGSVAAFIPDPEFDPKRAQETGAHGLAADAHGAIYGAEVYSQSVKKYVR